MHPAPDSTRFENLQARTDHPRPLETDFAAPVIARGVLCNLRAIELDRLIVGLSLTAGGVLGVLIARVVGE